jgi:hypothetical protein
MPADELEDWALSERKILELRQLLAEDSERESQAKETYHRGKRDLP